MARPRRKKRSSTQPAPPAQAATARCAWTSEEEREFLDYLVTRKSQKGDSLFRIAIFNDAAAHIAPFHVKGAVKTGIMCRDKFRLLKDKFEAVRAIKNYSGLEWSEKHGANIGPSTEHVWSELVAVEPRVAPFKNSGWSEDLYDKMYLLVPSKAKGGHVFNGATAAAAGTAPARGDSAADTDAAASPVHGSPTSDDSTSSQPSAEEKDSDSSSSSSTPPRPTQKTPQASATPPPTTAKRVHRTFEVPAESKRPRLTPMSKTVMGFGDDFRTFTNLMTDVLQPSTSSGLEATPKRKSRAMERAQMHETWLDDANLIRLLRVLETDSNAADAYLTIKKESLRQAWVKDRLNMGDM